VAERVSDVVAAWACAEELVGGAGAEVSGASVVSARIQVAVLADVLALVFVAMEPEASAAALSAFAVSLVVAALV
jgi:hypothetical protein